MRNIIIADLKQTPLEEQLIEIVERKGLGHPDYICDAVADRISVSLSRAYIEKAGTILHHNVDKALLRAGETEPKFKGGTVEQPILFVIGDRATDRIDGRRIDVEEIAAEAAKTWFRKNMRFLDPDEHVKYQIELKPGSVGLTDIFKRNGKFLGANDTSAAVGYAPMTRTEKTVLQTENYLNSEQFKKRFPESGEDIKVMAFRNGNDLQLTVAMAIVDRYVANEEDYFEKKTKIFEEINRYVAVNTDFDLVDVQLNTLDVKGRGLGGLYLTVLGTSAESGDSGQVGRGNRVNGLISLNRPFCSEAAAGKNPVSHTGKIYSIAATQIAELIVKENPDVKNASVLLLSQIGKPIDQPRIASVSISYDGPFEKIKPRIRSTVDHSLENITEVTNKIVEGKLRVF